jgi:hypothetical protein
VGKNLGAVQDAGHWHSFFNLEKKFSSAPKTVTSLQFSSSAFCKLFSVSFLPPVRE